jgi:uncharacterized protein YjbJ (UPF0337 family)
MNRQQVRGVTNKVTGEIKEQVGKLTGDRSTTVGGQARQVKGELQKSVGDARETVRHDERELERTREIERSRDLDR